MLYNFTYSPTSQNREIAVPVLERKSDHNSLITRAVDGVATTGISGAKTTPMKTESEPTLVGGSLYIGSSDSRRVRAIDPKNGHVLWAAQVCGWTWGTPLAVNDTVYYATGGTDKYFITQKGSLGALDRKSGAIRWRKPILLTSPNHVSGYANSLAYANGKIIAAGLDSTIVALPTQ
jgi:hypothetical protein